MLCQRSPSLCALMMLASLSPASSLSQEKSNNASSCSSLYGQSLLQERSRLWSKTRPAAGLHDDYNDAELYESSASLKEHPLICNLVFDSNSTRIQSKSCEAIPAPTGAVSLEVPFHFVWVIPAEKCEVGAMEACSLEAAGREGHVVNLWLFGGDGQSLECAGVPSNVSIRRFKFESSTVGFGAWYAEAANRDALEAIDAEHQTNFWRAAILEQEPGVYLDSDIIVRRPSIFARETEIASMWLPTPEVGQMIPPDAINNAILKFERNSLIFSAFLSQWHAVGRSRLQLLKNDSIGYNVLGPLLLSEAIVSHSHAGYPVPRIFNKVSVYPSICEDFGSEFVSVHGTLLCGAIEKAFHTGKQVSDCSRSFFQEVCPATMSKMTEERTMFFQEGSADADTATSNKLNWMRIARAVRRLYDDY